MGQNIRVGLSFQEAENHITIEIRDELMGCAKWHTHTQNYHYIMDPICLERWQLFSVHVGPIDVGPSQMEHGFTWNL